MIATKALRFFKLSLVLFLCSLSFFALAQKEPHDYQRYILIKNELPFPIYPVVTVGKAYKDFNTTRILAYTKFDPDNYKNNVGLQHGQTMKIQIPMLNNPQEINWYDSGRVYILPVDPLKYEKYLNADIKTVKLSDVNIHCEIVNGGAASCFAGGAKAAYPLDTPAQLVEFTFDADSEGGGLVPDGKYDSGIPKVDVDVSYVDDVYLPVALDFDNKGKTGYIGTTMSFDKFQPILEKFEEQSAWSKWAAYVPNNWLDESKNAIRKTFEDEPPGKSHPLYGKSHIPAMYNLIHNVTVMALSPLYTPPIGGTNFIIEGTVGVLADRDKVTGKNKESVTHYLNRWMKWVGANNPCGQVVSHRNFFPKGPAFDDIATRTAFCNAFQKSVNVAWNYFKVLDRPLDNEGKPSPDEQLCSRHYPNPEDENQCILSKIVGFRSQIGEGNLPSNVQASMRGVPFIEEPYDLLLLTKLPDSIPLVKKNGEELFEDKNKQVGNTFYIKRAFAIVQSEKGKLYEFNDRGLCNSAPTEAGKPCEPMTLSAEDLNTLLSKTSGKNDFYTRQIDPSAFDVHLSVKDEFQKPGVLQAWDEKLKGKSVVPNPNHEVHVLSEIGKMYHLDKWLTFWISPSQDDNNVFSLNPFTHFVHAKPDDPNGAGIDALSYSFSIDDLYGNVRDEASGFIIDVGGKSILSHHLYDPYQQYHLNWPKNWGSIRISNMEDFSDNPRNENPDAKGGSVKISRTLLDDNKPLYIEVQTTKHQSKNDPKLLLKVTLDKAKGKGCDGNKVKDLYTGLCEEVDTLIYDKQYCKDKSTDDSPDTDLIAACNGVVPNAVPSGELMYISLAKEDRPKVNINLPGFDPLPDGAIRWRKPGKMQCSQVEADRVKVTWPVAFTIENGKPVNINRYELTFDRQFLPCNIIDKNSCTIKIPSHDGPYQMSVVAIGKMQANLQDTCKLSGGGGIEWSKNINVIANAENSSAAISWDAATKPDGASFTYAAYVDGTPVGKPSSNTSVTVSNLARAKEHTVKVVVSDDRNDPEVEATTTFAFMEPIKAIIEWNGNVSHTIGADKKSATITWPAARVIGKPDVKVKFFVTFNNETRNDCNPGINTTCTVHDLTSKKYDVAVTAEAGQVASKTKTDSFTIGGKPSIKWDKAIKPTVTEQSVSIAWGKPILDPADPNDPLLAKAILSNGASCEGPVSAGSCGVNNLAAGDYTVTVTVSDQKKLADPVPSNPEPFTIAGGKKAVIEWPNKDLEGPVAGTTLTIIWKPATLKNAPAGDTISYAAKLNSGETCSSAGTSCQIKGLTPGKTYTVTVIASDVGKGGAEPQPSNSLTVKIPQPPPVVINKPTDLVAYHDNQVKNLVVVAFNSDYAAKGYKLNVRLYGNLVTLSPYKGGFPPKGVSRNVVMSVGNTSYVPGGQVDVWITGPNNSSSPHATETVSSTRPNK